MRRGCEKEVKELRKELRNLSLRVDSQQDQLGELTSVVEDLQREKSEKEEKRRVEESEAAVLPLRRAEEAGAEGSYSLVEDNLLSQIPTPVSSGDSVVPWSFREEVARDIGSSFAELSAALGEALQGETDFLCLPSFTWWSEIELEEFIRIPCLFTASFRL